jgi:hypothetical protein
VGKHVKRASASCALGVLVSVLVSIGLAPAALAEGGRRFALSVDRHVIHSGEHFTATATATYTCQWMLEWNGDRRVRSGRTFTAAYTAPAVTRPTRIPLHGTCFYSPSEGRRIDVGGNRAVGTARGMAQSITVTVPPSWRHTVVVTVLPPGAAVSPPASGGGSAHPGGVIPNTGGPALLVLLAALGAVLVGSAMVRTSSRRVSA